MRTAPAFKAFSLSLLLALAACAGGPEDDGVDPSSEGADDAELADVDDAVDTAEGDPDDEVVASTSDALSTNNCRSMTVARIKAKKFRGEGGCCKVSYNVRGEAGGWCARRTKYLIESGLCQYYTQAGGGWGSHGKKYWYAARCKP